MNKTLQFKVSIQASRDRVWQTMLGDETYTTWNADFCEGSRFHGAWVQGTKIRFLAPNGNGTTSVVATVRPHEFVSIQHIGEVKAGVEDTTSENVRAWAPAYETFAFSSEIGGTEVHVCVEIGRAHV